MEKFGLTRNTVYQIKTRVEKMGARFCRPAWRDGFPPVGLNFIGFRVALAPKIGKVR